MNYLKEDEFNCSCCGQNKMNAAFLEMLYCARLKAKVPFIINSGYRCEAHNKAVGGSVNSSHMKGLAVDIKAVSDAVRWKIIIALIMAGFTRIGIRYDFIHVDLDMDKNPERLWVY